MTRWVGEARAANGTDLRGSWVAGPSARAANGTDAGGACLRLGVDARAASGTSAKNPHPVLPEPGHQQRAEATALLER